MKIREEVIKEAGHQLHCFHNTSSAYRLGYLEAIGDIFGFTWGRECASAENKRCRYYIYDIATETTIWEEFFEGAPKPVQF